MRKLEIIKWTSGALCGVATYLWGGLDGLLTALLATVAVDYVTGVMAAAYRGALSSEIGYRGILRKAAIFVVVALSHLVGRTVGIVEIRSVVIGFYLANEGVSILENAGEMGLPLPKRLRDVLAQLRGDADGEATDRAE